jgi:hypothetical protein
MNIPDSEPRMVWLDSDLAYSKSPVDDIPEWRRPNGGGAILQSGPRRKPYEEEPLSNAFSSSYPPRLVLMGHQVDGIAMETVIVNEGAFHKNGMRMKEVSVPAFFWFFLFVIECLKHSR